MRIKANDNVKVISGEDRGTTAKVIRVNRKLGKLVVEGVNRVAQSGSSGGQPGILLITHYTRILRYIQPDFVHVFIEGRIVEEGGPELADRLEDEGYDRFLKVEV